MNISGGGNTVSNGWFYYLNEIHKFTGGTVTPAPGHVPLVIIDTNATSLEFADASTPDVIIDKTAHLIEDISVTDSIHFPVAALRPWIARDPAVYGQLNNINATIGSFVSGWVDEESLHGTTIHISGSGSFSGGTVAFNRFKGALGLTFIWQLSLRNYTITGSILSIQIKAPNDLYASGGTWINNNYRGMGLIKYGGGAVMVLGYQLVSDFSGAPILEFGLFDGSAITAGSNVDIDVTVLTEFLI